MFEKLITIKIIESNCFGVSSKFFATIEALSSFLLRKSLSIGFKEKNAVSPADIIAVIINNINKSVNKNIIEFILILNVDYF
jgi:hypothetical protein